MLDTSDQKKNTKDEVVKGEGLTFYSPEETIIAYNEKRVDLHAWVKVRLEVKEGDKLWFIKNKEKGDMRRFFDYVSFN